MSPLLSLDLASDDFRDRVNGCWMGKNCGGTLGAPLEQAFGSPQLFDVWWYPRLEVGGIPNDDLEMQLFWLKALEEVGPGLRASHLAQYWLDHIRYNPDEYGFCKTNLRLGLLPPVAGAYNNWFKDCMGCPIRSEIWACVAPGAPRIACRYAYEDAIVDHAGGESVYGEFFNAAVESAAFVVADRDTLIEIGLSYVPEHTKTFAALRAALDAHAAGVDWKEARERVLAVVPHYNAQYSPINLGFQLVGWLYGEDFGDAICKAVNCGYDTDCTGATLGSILGIMGGRRGLPLKWTEPLGEEIATSERGGGVRHASDGPNPVPATIAELTERVCRQARRVLAWHGIVPGQTTLAELYADESIHTLGKKNPLRIDFPAHQLGMIGIGIQYEATPAIGPGKTRPVVTHLGNGQADPATVECRWQVPPGWTVSPETRSATVTPQGESTLVWEITAPDAGHLEVSNLLYLQTAVRDRPAQQAVPVTLIGASRFRRTDIYPANDLSAVDLLDAVLDPERLAGDPLSEVGRPGRWSVFEAPDNALPLESFFDEPGTLYVQTFVYSPEEQPRAWIGAPSTGPVRMWINGELCAECRECRPFRPCYAGTWQAGQPYGHATLRQGWNEVLLKFARTTEVPPFACHLVICDSDTQGGLVDVGRTRFPWDA